MYKDDLRLIDLTVSDLRIIIADALADASNNNETKIGEESYVEIDEACEILHLSKPSVYRKCSQRKLKFYKSGHKLLFKKIELLDFVEKNKKICINKLQK
jgi:excisionase family DNA binding protein